MEGLLILLAVLFGPALFRTMFAEGATAHTRRQVRNEHGELSVRIRGDEVTLDSGERMRLLVVEMKGLIPSYVGAAIGVVRIEDALGRSVRSMDPSKQELETLYFQEPVRSEGEVFVFRSDVYFTDWVTISVAPTVFLIPAESGNVPLRARLALHHLESASDVPIYKDGNLASGVAACFTKRSSSASFEFPVGYLQLEEHREVALRASMTLAVACSAVDGSIDESELEVIRGEARRRCEGHEREQALKVAAGESVRDGLQRVREGTKPLDLAERGIVRMLEVDRETLSLEAIELCVQVLGADGSAAEKEVDLVYHIADRLKVDRSLVRTMLEKKLAAEGLMLEGVADYSVLGISSAMDGEEIRRVLNQAFRKWNALANNERPETAQKAKEMLELIGRARAEYLE